QPDIVDNGFTTMEFASGVRATLVPSLFTDGAAHEEGDARDRRCRAAQRARRDERTGASCRRRDGTGYPKSVIGSGKQITRPARAPARSDRRI
ncbi:hypothetical protein ACTGUT_12420, partial [Streptococcus suis]